MGPEDYNRPMKGYWRAATLAALLVSLGCADLEQTDDADSGADDGAATEPSDDGDDGADDDGAPDGADDGADDGGPVPTDLPQSTGPCPAFGQGRNEFCPEGLDECRHAWVVRGDADGGPLTVYWQASVQPPQEILEFGTPAALVAMTQAEGGIAVFPEADPNALAREEGFPWWVVENTPDDPPDHDFVFLDEIVGCAVESGLIDPERVNTGGFGPGGIMTSFVLERRGYFASAVSWSGGHFDSMTPAAATPTVAIHGGPNDCACTSMTPDDCYCFQEPSERLAIDMSNAGAFAFVCDHSMGDQMNNHHADVLGAEGVEFMRLSRRGQPHEFEGYELGSSGVFVLDNYCYAPGDESPWAPWN